MKTAVVLLSGGLDSTTALAQAFEDGYEAVHAVTLGYGSLHNESEGQAAEDVVAWFNGYGMLVTHHRVELPHIFGGGNSALMGEVEMPQLTYKQIQETEGPSPTVVPFRNANLISVATTIAVGAEAEAVYIATHAEDAHNWAYPDCSPEFLGAMANAVYFGTYLKVRLIFPFIWMTKADIVLRAAVVGAPLQLTWSCYRGGDIHCGSCPTCIERSQAFYIAGYVDPTTYLYEIQHDIHTFKAWPVEV